MVYRLKLWVPGQPVVDYGRPVIYVKQSAADYSRSVIPDQTADHRL
jgi:hypothetical protein